MPHVNPVIRPSLGRTIAALATCIACVVVPVVGRAEDTPDTAAQASAKTSSPSAMVSLINRLASRGLLTKQDEADLVGMAEADAADARVEAAEARLAAARAEAAAARARVQLSKASADLAAARANATQLAANQAAAVRLLLGQGQGAAAAAPASPGQGAAVSDASSPSAPAEEVAAASTPDSIGATAEAQPAPSPAPAGMNLTRNEDGAVVVPEEPQAPSTAADSDSTEGDQPAPARHVAHRRRAAAKEPDSSMESAQETPEDDQPAPAPSVAHRRRAAPTETDSSMAAVPEASVDDQPAPEPPVALARRAAPTATAAAGDTGLTRNEEGAVVVREEGPSAQAAVPDTSSDEPAPAAKEIAANSGAGAPKQEDSGTDADQAAPAPSAAPSSAAEPASTESASVSVPAAEETTAQPDAAEAPAGSGPPRTAAEAPVGASEAAPAGEAAAETRVSTDDVVRVAYVPEVVKQEIREEVKNEVIAEARKENWGAPSSGPEWVSKFTLYGDIRVRAEEVINHAGNDNTGAFPNFNAINTGAPFDTSGNVFSPQYNVDQNRNRERLRARLGAAVAVSGGFTAGVRIATGNDNQPVSENQTFGAAGNAQGGDFAKYSLWLDRAYIRYQSGGDPGDSFWMTFGRFDNPFFSTSLIWANEIGFDGVAASIPLKAHLNGQPSDSFKPYLVAGAFPVFDTDLNYATNQPAKFKSYDKWLYAAQLGFDAKLSGDYKLKAAAALYDFKNIQGQLSSPFTPLTTSDAGDTDASRPSWAQNGNTYMALRDITPGPLNSNGTIDQFQYYGLATPFKEFAVTEGLYYNHFEPFQISLVSEWVKNLAFDRAAVVAKAVNNGGTANYIGGNTGWISTLKFGDSVIKELGDWNASIGYRRVESDAVVDGFNDADFGGILFGTNLKGFTLTADVGLATDVWMEARWMSASAIAGPTFKNDLLQLDLNTKF